MPYGVGLSVASQLINTYSKDSFSQFRSAGPDGEAATCFFSFSDTMSLKQSYFVVLVPAAETSGSDEENLFYSPASDLGFRSRKKKKPKSHSKTSQSLFSVVLSISHGLVSLQTSAKVKSNPPMYKIPLSKMA